jgi:hypothetical protein
MISSRHNLNDKLNDIDPTTTSYQIIKNIDNDEKYFVPKDAKAEFDKLSINDMRNKKVYYDSGYKLTKGETESDLTKYLGGKKAHEDLIANIKDIIESYPLIVIIVTTAIVLMAIILAYIIRNLNEALNPGNTVMNQASAMANASDNASEAAADCINSVGSDESDIQEA